MQGQLPLNALRAFEVAARHLSFTKAADELNVTPAAVSQQIKMLEEYLGTPLFHRLTRGLALTKRAQAALPSLESGFRDLAQGMEQLRNHSGEQILDVWVASSFASKCLLPRLHRFTARYPHIDLRISASADLVEQESGGASVHTRLSLLQGMDIGIAFGEAGLPGFQTDSLMPASVVPMCSPGLLKDPQRPINEPADFLNHTLLHDDTSYKDRPSWTDWLRLAGVQVIDNPKALHFNHVSLALEAAAEGQGVVLSIEQIAQLDIESGRLVVPFEPRIPLRSEYYLISPETVANSHEVSAFREWVLSEFAAPGDELSVA